MKKALKTIGIIFAALVVIVGLWVTNNFIYPFTADDPNFTDVEAAFAKLEFPSDWQEISSSENRGIAGRGCDPFNSSGCFSKNRTFKVVNTEEAINSVKGIFERSGCIGIDEKNVPEGNSSTDPKTATNISCQPQSGITYSASSSLQRGQMSVTAKTNN